ncbi:hypothetical protein DFA_00297 [Cavenderia fasciculata]|uniref:Uncharacterized protein n=1 Tax=Cavenderia fasciculata TaxID=261658 RepID=F4PY59_CACFS|nr:uncharacterized protein DFA_00297 [Cavenderia fasciculata]EGG19719.1 hypothetical protein DFA_00297 [Cavenderia fasciculata]|eukprot:XP_004358013.1 hypothetical protein DFA_00297 [Cavenderia fasciculata]
MPGLRFFWWGDFEGYQYQLDVHLRREESEPAIGTVQGFYQNLTAIVSNPVFKYGDFEYLNVTGSSDSSQLIAYKWSYQGEKRLCVFNFSGQSGSGSIILSDAQPVNGNDTIPVTDLLSDTTYYRSASEMRSQGLFVVVNTWYGQIFTY